MSGSIDAAGNPHITYLVRRGMPGRAPVTLDASGDIAKGSLALSPDGKTVSWKRGSISKSAPVG